MVLPWSFELSFKVSSAEASSNEIGQVGPQTKEAILLICALAHYIKGSRRVFIAR